MSDLDFDAPSGTPEMPETPESPAEPQVSLALGKSVAPDSDTSAYAPPTDVSNEPSSYSPPVEPRTPWAAAGWATQTPPHWFEPLPGQQPTRRRRRRRGSYFAALFVVALIAAVAGSALTYAALMATNMIGSPAAIVTQPTPTPLIPLATDESTPAPVVAPHLTITQAAQRVSPAVVTITVRSGQATDPFSLPETGIGSGIIYDANGWVLTNRHVVTDATQVTVELNDGRQVQGSVYGVDSLTDLAIVKIDATDLPVAPMGDSSELQPGQTAIVIGSPLGTFTNSVTSGVVSALGRSLVVTDPVTNEQRRLRNLIQTDAAINPGNSGGPLIDESGTVVGVSTAYAQGAQGLFFAIPINIAKPIMRQAVAGQALSRPWIGIIYVPLDGNVANENKLSIDYGAWISQDTGSGDPPIVAGSPAEKAGLQAGDIVTSIDGHRVDGGAGLDDILSMYEPGDTLTLQVLRDGQTIPIEITLGTRPANLD